MSSPRKGGTHVRIKQEKHDGFEVHEARSKLDGVLQTLVDKAEDSAIASEDESTKMSPEQSSNKDLPSTSASPSKRSSGKNPRKRRKKDNTVNEFEKSTIETARLQHTYIMKLFDRSVDLAQFDNSTPLYPICREWMLNEPQTRRALRRSPSPALLPCDDSDEDIKYVYRLPLPHPQSCGSPSNPTRDVRIPSPLPQPDEELRMYEDPNQAPQVDTLLHDHLKRWKNIRHKWKDSSQANQARYIESYNILKNMYDRQ